MIVRNISASVLHVIHKKLVGRPTDYFAASSSGVCVVFVVSRSPAPARRIRRDSASPVMAERIPLILANEKKPPLASSETDDEFDDEGEAVSAPYPGVDDGFFNGDADKPKEENPGSENLPKHDSDDVPVIMSRAGPDGGSEKPDGGSEKPDSGSKKADGGSEEPDGGSEKSDEAYRIMTAGVVPSNYPGRLFPYPTYGHDIETGSVIPDLDLIPDVNVYQHKKTVAQGMMDLALFSANANQLRYVLESFNRHPNDDYCDHVITKDHSSLKRHQ
ncbi:hypothetical protein GEV33_006516 [Tenebrio molitor]|uniref:Uncharacterized protein n=1 Tax=Tenebrio molitor TaxID=7067 RepID=A0A8J6LD52_TENMO|nr:hypothetical protein GEV33_006516 [Tenebrio molitor]